ncbi:tetratricopeptide repeat protein [Planobispora takensis]|nr:tetratricopeptide repeat protein [Planobispora takensis]
MRQQHGDVRAMERLGDRPSLNDLLAELDRWRVRAARGRGKTRLSLQDLAGATGVPRSSLANYLSGATVMPLDVLDAVVLALGADPAEARSWTAAWERATEDHLGGSGDGPVPDQLPSPATGFCGRHQALRELARASAPQNVSRCCLVVGTPGVGKTSLVLQWARSAAHEFPDGRLFLNLGGRLGEEPLNAASALACLLHSMGVRSIPTDLAGRVAQYRDLFSRKRVLIVLDDAVSAGQLRPLLVPVGPSLVMATSRDSLAGLVARDGAHRLVLDRMSAAESVALLEGLVGAARIRSEPDASTELAQHCAGLPLALRVMAERMAHRPLLGPGRLVTELQELEHTLDGLEAGGDSLADVRSVFQSSYRHLSPEAARLFRLLGLFPGGDLDLCATANLGAASRGKTQRALDELYRGHLVEEPRPGRFALHNLLRAFAAERAEAEEPPGERFAARTRLLSWYLDRAESAVKLIDPHRPLLALPPIEVHTRAPELTSAKEALRWLDDERVTLVAAIRNTAGGLEEFAWRLANNLWQYFFLRGHLEEWIETHRLALGVADRSGDELWAAITRTHLAAAHAWRGQVAVALEHRKLALAGFQKIGYVHGQAVSYCHLGDTFVLRGDYDLALDHFERAFIIGCDAGDMRARVLAQLGLGHVNRLTGRFDDALVHQLQVLDLVRQAGSVRGEALARVALGVTYLLMHEDGQASLHLRRAWIASRRVSDRPSELLALSGLGTLLSRAGHHGRAIRLHRHALLRSERLSGPGLAGKIMIDLADTLLSAGDAEAAAELRRQAASLASAAGDAHEQARAVEPPVRAPAN